MKLTTKIIPIDLRRRRALDKAHAQEVKAARAAFTHPDAEYEPQPGNNGERQRVVRLKSPTQRHDGETS
ncbi:MAG: hypothetical protein H0V34_03950 [Gammaproteobacteria bacterium]|nr:hypothetical protein [Gammaproteobacteria bacterium]